jgi:death-on-curing protein
VKAPIWLHKHVVLAMHAESLADHGGSAGLRDEGLLDSALARPLHLHAYEKADLCRLAAAYAHGIAKNHPFLDGNKRAAFLAAAVFLQRNGLRLVAEPGHAAVFVLALADGSLSETAFAAWLRDNTMGARKKAARQPREKARRSPNAAKRRRR